MKKRLINIPIFAGDTGILCGKGGIATDCRQPDRFPAQAPHQILRTTLMSLSTKEENFSPSLTLPTIPP